MLEVQNDRQSLEFISSRFDTVSQSVNAAEQYKIRFYLKVSLYPTLLRSFHQTFESLQSRCKSICDMHLTNIVSTIRTTCFEINGNKFGTRKLSDIGKQEIVFKGSPKRIITSGTGFRLTVRQAQRQQILLCFFAAILY